MPHREHEMLQFDVQALELSNRIGLRQHIEQLRELHDATNEPELHCVQGSYRAPDRARRAPAVRAWKNTARMEEQSEGGQSASISA